MSQHPSLQEPLLSTSGSGSLSWPPQSSLPFLFSQYLCYIDLDEKGMSSEVSDPNLHSDLRIWAA